MNILMLVTKRQKRGAEVSAANLSMQLIKRGHRIIWVGLYKPSGDVLEIENAVNIDLNIKEGSLLSISKCIQLAKIIREYKADIVQANGSATLKYAVFARWFMRKGSASIIYRNISTVSFWIRNSFLKRHFYSWICNKADHVVSVGEKSKKDFMETFHFPSSKISVINRGIPVETEDKIQARKEVASEFGLPEDANILLWAGALSSEKNPTFMINVMKELCRYDYKAYLVMAGKGPESELIKEMIADVSLEKHVVLAGYRKDLSKLLAAADILLLSSYIEGVPGVVLEAAVQSTPTIAVNVGGVAEAIRDDETGMLMRNHDEPAFAGKIRELLDNPVKRRRMGEKAQLMVRNQFDENIKTEEFISLYQRLIS